MDEDINARGHSIPLHSLPANDYVSPGLSVIIPDAAFPNMVAGDTRLPQWIWLRKWVAHNWYIDKRLPYAGFASRDEAAILYNTALKFQGMPCLEVGCWRGWSAVHLALGAGSLHVIDPIIDDPEFAESIRESCAAAGVLNSIEFHSGFSPGAIDTLSQARNLKWSLIFIDAEHEGEAPRLDAQAAIRNAADDAIVLFHDLTSPFVAAGLHAMRDAGWRTMVYQTMQIMGVAWRGDVEPVRHIPDPRVFWTLPKHLAGYEVSGWAPTRMPRSDGAWWPDMSMEDRRNAAMMRAQATEDKLVAETLTHLATQHGFDAATSRLAEATSAIDNLSGETNRLSTELRVRSIQLQALDAEMRTVRGELLEEKIGRRRESGRNQKFADAIDEQRRVAIELDQRARRAGASAITLAAELDHQRLLYDRSLQLAQNFTKTRVILGLIRRNASQRESMIRGWIGSLDLTGETFERFAIRFSAIRPLLGLLRRSARSRQALVSIDLVQAGRIRISPEPEPELSADLSSAPVIPYSLAWTWHSLVNGNGHAQLSPWRAYFWNIELDDDRLLAWVKLANTRWPLADHDMAGSLETIRSSPLFNAQFYRGQAGLESSALDPAVHYLLVGEALGLRPSPAFCPSYYGRRNMDVVMCGLCLLDHYVHFGSKEGRLPTAFLENRANAEKFDPARENILLVVHEASRTGAPILAWNIAKELGNTYNVFTILIGPGALTADFQAICADVYGPFPPMRRSVPDIKFSLASLFARSFKYAIVNSSESRMFLQLCSDNLIPTLFLMHEFGSYVYPAAELASAFDCADEIIFPAHMVAQSSEAVHPPLRDRSLKILPQGMSELPQAVGAADCPDAPEGLRQIQTMKQNGAFIVLGAGSVTLRKGVDIFISVAATVARANPGRPIHFVWIGHGYRPDHDMGYSIYLHEQIIRTGLTETVTFLDEVSDLDMVYALADAFAMTSRLDPLPNVSIDAALRGIPIICFKDASGIAELLLKNAVTSSGVVNHLDAGKVGEMIINLANDNDLWSQLSEATSILARQIFDMKAYVRQLDAIGSDLFAGFARRRNAAEIISAKPCFSQDFFVGAEPILETRDESIKRYVAGWHNRDRSTTWQRRPAPGFNAMTWQKRQPSGPEDTNDPYAEFLESGSPKGPWQIKVLRCFPEPDRIERGRIATILHVYTDHTDSFALLFERFSANMADADLLVSAPTSLHDALREVLDRAKIQATILGTKLPDVLSLATYLEEEQEYCHYEVVAHFVASSRSVFPAWRDYHWESLLGGQSVSKAIIGSFVSDPTLGLVFPAEPYYPAWDEESWRRLEDAASALSTGRLVTEIGADFPEGGMFWARRDVMRHLAALKTSTHDLAQLCAGDPERLLPLACAAAGFTVAVTYKPATDW